MKETADEIWRNVGIVETVLYFVLFAISLYPTIKLLTVGSRFRGFYFRYYLMIAVRITGSIMLAIFSANPDINEKVLTGVIVLTGISLGFLGMLLCYMVKFIVEFNNPEYAEAEKITLGGVVSKIIPKQNDGIIVEGFQFIQKVLSADYTKPVIWEELCEKLIFVSLLLSIIGSGIGLPTEAPLRKASSILYVFALVVIGLTLIVTYKGVRSYSTNSRSLKNSLLLISTLALIFLLARAITNIVSAFTSYDDDGLNKFTVFEGTWTLYVFPVFLFEYLSAIMYTIAPWLVLTAEYDRLFALKHQVGYGYGSENYDEESKTDSPNQYSAPQGPPPSANQFSAPQGPPPGRS